MPPTLEIFYLVEGGTFDRHFCQSLSTDPVLLKKVEKTIAPLFFGFWLLHPFTYFFVFQSLQRCMLTRQRLQYTQVCFLCLAELTPIIEGISHPDIDLLPPAQALFQIIICCHRFSEGENLLQNADPEANTEQVERITDGLDFYLYTKPQSRSSSLRQCQQWMPNPWNYLQEKRVFQDQLLEVSHSLLDTFDQDLLSYAFNLAPFSYYYFGFKTKGFLKGQKVIFPLSVLVGSLFFQKVRLIGGSKRPFLKS